MEDVPITGGAPTTLAYPLCGGDDPFGIAVAGSTLIWSNTRTGTVVAMTKP